MLTPSPILPLITLLLLALMAGCGNSKNAGEKQEASYVVEARERFGDAFDCLPNATDEFILCAHRPDTTAMNPIPRVAFFVFDRAANEVKLEEAQFAGSVKWADDYEIEMTLTPGIVTDDGRGAPKYRIDARSGDRRRLDGLERIPH